MAYIVTAIYVFLFATLALAGPQVQVNWTDNVSGEVAFEIKRKATLASPEIVVGTVSPGSTSFTDPAPLPGGNYYSVQAVHGTTRIETPFTHVHVPVMTGTIDNLTLQVVP